MEQVAKLSEVPAKPSLPKIQPDRGDLRGILAWHVRSLRVAKGWSQEKLALVCELDRTYVSAIERSVWNVSLSNIERLARALEVEPWTLLVPVE
ncbi:MAG: helix-turn-helix transcriptional regulator [Pseudorhodoferax sp.]